MFNVELTNSNKYVIKVNEKLILYNFLFIEYQIIRSPVRIRTIHKMRSGLLFVLVVTCISAQLYTTNADVQKTNESTRSLPKPPSQLLKKVREQIQAREGEEGNNYSINALV